MASKVYTAQEMREAADRFAFEEDGSRSRTIADMLRQAADMRERCDNYLFVVKQIKDEHIRDGLARMMDEIINGDQSDAFEREEKREKKYEYSVKSIYGEVGRLHYDEQYKSTDRLGNKAIIVRREVGEWEVVRDGD